MLGVLTVGVLATRSGSNDGDVVTTAEVTGDATLTTPPTSSIAEAIVALPSSGYPDIDVRLQARYEGYLRLDENGCLYAENAGAPLTTTVLLWPKGWQLHLLPDGSAEVLDAAGSQRLRPGDYFGVAGGGAPVGDAELSNCPTDAGVFSMHDEPSRMAPPSS